MICSFARHAVRRELREWADKEALRLSKPKSPAAKGKGAVILARLERELAKNPVPDRLHNPAVPELYDREINEHSRAEILRWKAEKRTRTILGAIGKKFRGESTTKLYAYLRAQGFKVKTYSEIPLWERERKGINSIFDYQSKLWLFCGLLTEKPYDLRADRCSWDVPVWGAERYIHYLNAVNQRASLQAQIDSIRALSNPHNA